MWAITLIVAALVLGLFAFSFAIGAPIFAVPIAIAGILALGGFDVRRRRRQAREMHRFREQGKAESVEFTRRDKETLVSE
jgi:hypothetical protein